MLGDMEIRKIKGETAKQDVSLSILSTEIRLKQMNDIFSEIVRIKSGLTNYTCKLRNLFQILTGEMELYCDVDISSYISLIVNTIENGNIVKNWDIIVKCMLSLYKEIFRYCN